MRNPKDRDEVLNNCMFYYNNETNFDNDAPIHLEIGMGKGNFLIGMAKAYPNINFIGIEKYSAVASLAIKKIADENLNNLKVVVGDIVETENLLISKIEKIYLNFSDPWPKERHAKRRLTHKNQLDFYNDLFKNGKEIEMKTDNLDLFTYSLESFINYGYTITELHFDLHKEDKFNILTEYEKKFSEDGVKIKYVKVIKD